MPDIPLDFSAISQLYCARAYQLSCVKGIDSSSSATNFGSAVHKYVEARGLGDKRSAIIICAEIATKYKAPLDKLIMCAVKIDLVYRFGNPIFDTIGTPLIEYKFSIPYKEVDGYNIILCGTVDAIEYKNRLTFIDWKTTACTATALDRTMSEYATSFQLPFYLYIIHKYLAKFLPIDLSNAALSLNMAGVYRYVCHSYNPVDIKESSEIYISPEDILYIEELIDYCIPKMISIHRRTTLCPPEGSIYKMCPKCNFRDLCAIRNHDRLVDTINRQPTRQYDPTNFR